MNANRTALCLLTALAIALAAPSATALRYQSGPLPTVPCPDLPPGSGGVVGLVMDAADSTAATGCTAVAGVEQTVREAEEDAETTINGALGIVGPFVDLAQDSGCIVLFGSADGSDDLAPYSRDACREIVLGL